MRLRRRLPTPGQWLGTAAVLRAAVRAVWVGDSHASFLAAASLESVGRSHEGDVVVWLGPRLMYSVARDGFPDPLLPRLTGLSWRLRNRPLVVAFGEIDCRVHLVERVAAGDDLSFVTRYVDRIRELRARLAAPVAVVVGPTPPSDVGMDNPEFPRGGTLADRVAVTRLLDERLAAAVAGETSIVFVSLAFLAGSDGSLTPEFTDDGVHANAAGASEVRARLDGLLSVEALGG